MLMAVNACLDPRPRLVSVETTRETREGPRLISSKRSILSSPSPSHPSSHGHRIVFLPRERELTVFVVFYHFAQTIAAMLAMPALLFQSRLPLLSIVSRCTRPLLRAPSTTPHSGSILRFSELEFRTLSSKAHLSQGLGRSSSGWTNLFQVPTPYSPRASVSQVYSMATPDAGTSIVVYVTVPNKETGTKLAHGIIENKLAACVNQIPGVESTYWWEGKVETDTEILLMIKTRQSLLGELTDHVKNNHPYDTPEVIALPITGGSEKYLKWIGDNTKNAEVA